VKEAMEDPIFSYLLPVGFYESHRPIPYKVDQEVAHDFAGKVLDRFRNPHIEHQWISNFGTVFTKMKLRR